MVVMKHEFLFCLLIGSIPIQTQLFNTFCQCHRYLSTNSHPRSGQKRKSSMPVCLWRKDEECFRERQTHTWGGRKGGTVHQCSREIGQVRKQGSVCVWVCVEGYRGGVQVAWSWRRPGPLSPGSARLHLSSAGTSAAQGALVTQR